MSKPTLHEKITNQILSAMKQATAFQMPWHTNQASPLNALTNNHYHGINIISLWSRSMKQGYDSSEWATYNQWKNLGAQVEKGERGSTIIVYKPLVDNEGVPIKQGEPPYRPQALIRSATVFNANQVSGYQSTTNTSAPTDDLTNRLADVDHYIIDTKACINHRGSRAFYSPKADAITMPKRSLFTGTSSSTPTEAYYSTLLHELIHWTGSDKRCNRDLTGRFGEHAYAREELVAELGSAFLCAELGITSQTRPDHASYIKSWIEVLKSDSKAIFVASSNATYAVNYLNQLQINALPIDQPLIAND